ncbi:PKD domain-containing protein [Chitinophaga sp. CF418]|uniref:PKD domain-containing protein n=1 Tax=Chitinophaga sp. CF418 TaxID=1855287 RepID=UPI0016600333|nr:PKD domain-containing protein [Chitinophaga sp. CF418]
MKHQYLRQFKHFWYALSCFTVLFLLSGAKAQAQNTVAFTADNWSGCGAVFVQFLNQSSPVGTASWDFGDGGATSTLWNPTRSFNRPGNFTVTLTVTFPNGQVSSTQHVVNVYNKPTVAFATSPITSCTPLNVTFTDQSTAGDGSISSINWDFGDGNGATGSTATHLYDKGGSIVATSIVTNSFGCTNSGSATLQINATPQVSFTSNNQGGCRAPTTVNFTNTTSLNTVGVPPAVTYLWDFGDGATSAVQHPSHDYTTTGTFTVKLTATTADGCTQTYTAPDYIVVTTATADFTIQQACTNASATFKNTTLPAPVSATWTFSDGTVQNTVDAVKAFTTAGPYSVTLKSISADGCEATVTRNFTISAPPTINFTMSPSAACSVPVNVQFTPSGAGATTWAWDFADGTTSNLRNPLHSFTAEGTYNVKVVAISAAGCKDSALNSISIKKPTLAITGTSRGCVPLNATFGTTIVSPDPVVSYAWNFGDGTTSTAPTPSHVYTTQGRYTVNLTITTQTGCTQTATYDVRAGSPINVDFTVNQNSGCQPTIYTFTDLSTPAIGGLTYLWTFEENGSAPGTSSVRNPTYVFNTIGMHDVTLTITNNGCSQSLTKTDYIETFAPIADFAIGPVDCANPFVRAFTDQTNWGTGIVGTYSWDFGDGTTSTTPSPSHTYTADGTYTVVLSVSNGTCTSTFSAIVRVITLKPVIYATPNVVCLGTSTALSVDPFPPGTITSFRWDFGDGRTGSGTSRPVVTYKNTGTYNVIYTANDVNGCPHLSDPLRVDVNGSVSKFVIDPRQCKDQPVSFTDQSTTRAGNTIVSWTFDFGDGTAPVVYNTQPINITHTYSVTDTFTVTLTVNDNTGCSSTSTQSAIIPDITAGFKAASNIACLNVPFQFENTSVTEPLTYAWTFGDGGTSTDKDPAHIYTVPGTYTVTLDITSPNGCTANVSTTDFLKVPNPIADFTFPNVAGDICPPVTVQFTNRSSDYLKTSWDFGDGSASDEDNPIHNYIRPGTFPVTLTVYSEGGCASPVAGPKDITIAGPDGSFTVTPQSGCWPLTASMTAVSATAQRFIWDFGDGYSVRTTTPASPSYTYQKEGVYYPIVLLEDARGCTVPAAGNPKITVDRITAAFSADVTQACDGGTVVFSDSTKGVSIDDGMAATYVWDFGVSGRTDDVATGPKPTFIYTAPGSYTVTLTATSYYGCVKDTTMQIDIEAKPVAQIAPVTPVCVGQPVQLVGTDTRNLPGTTWNWTTNNQQYNVQTPPAITYPQAGIFPAQLIITTASGLCSDTATENVQIEAYPTLSPTPVAASICRGQSVTLQANTQAGVDITWTDYNISDIKSASPVVTPDIDTTYHVVAVNTAGCSAQGDIKVTVSQPFTLTVNDGDICPGGAVQLHAAGALTYKWSPATGLSNTDIANPMATPDSTITYQLIGYGNDNCFTDTLSSTVTVHPAPVVNAGADMEVPSGTAVQLPVTGSSDITQIEWWPATSLSCVDCLTPVATPRENTTYSVKVTNAYGCTTIDDVTIKLVCSSGAIFLPNTFTPNSDGANDIFYIRGKGVKTVKSFRLYNRWGQQVFERTNFNVEDPAYGWDGRVNGQPVNPDVFIYVAELVCDSNETFTLKGNVMLVR